MLFKNIHIIDHTQDFVGDVRFDNGIITETGINLPINEDKVRDFSGFSDVLMPAFTDLHAHFRDPGFTYKEDVKSGSKAAVKGGFTAVNLMPNTKPVCSSMEIVQDVEKRIDEEGLIYANQTLSMTKDLEGTDIEHLKRLKYEEVPFITDDGKGVENTCLMAEIFRICKEKNITIMAHEEDSRFSTTDMRQAENLMTVRDLELCEKTYGKIHFCHVSTQEAIRAIAKAKKKGLPVSCEVTPHHLFATGEEVNHYRVNPPFREQSDIDALLDAIRQGVVDAIATDHAPHSPEDKANGSPGMTGLDIAFSIVYTTLVKKYGFSLQKVIQLMSANPSRIMKLNKGQIKVGMDADFVIANLTTVYKIDPSKFASKSHNTPFENRDVYGIIKETYRKGKKVY
jgi:dihydroorotase